MTNINKESKYKIGDRVLCKGGYHAHIIEVQKDWFGFKYVCRWREDYINSLNYSDKYSTNISGIKRSWQILCKN